MDPNQQPSSPFPIDLDPELIAEIDSLEPVYPVPDRVGRAVAEGLCWAMNTLGLQDVAELLAHGWDDDPASEPWTDEQCARWSETAADVLASWLRDHGVPRVRTWYPSIVAGGEYVMFQLKASPNGVERMFRDKPGPGD